MAMMEMTIMGIQASRQIQRKEGRDWNPELHTPHSGLQTTDSRQVAIVGKWQQSQANKIRPEKIYLCLWTPDYGLLSPAFYTHAKAFWVKNFSNT